MTKEFIDYIEDIIKAIDDVLDFVKNINYEALLMILKLRMQLSGL
jgi:uncharacterized protein with HEPN domain